VLRRKLRLQPKEKWLSMLRDALLGLTLFSTVGVFFCLLMIDWIIHRALYDYGLQFSLEWADPYWFLKRVSFAFLCGIAVCSVGVYLSLALKKERA